MRDSVQHRTCRLLVTIHVSISTAYQIRQVHGWYETGMMCNLYHISAIIVWDESESIDLYGGSIL